MKITLTILNLFAIYFLSFSQSPSIQWTKCLGGSNDDVFASIIPTNDGSYIIGGYTASNDFDVTGNHGPYDFWILKINSSGALIWQQCYGGTISETMGCMISTFDNNYVACGAANSNDGQVGGVHGGVLDDYWVLKIDSSGNLGWHHVYGGTGLEWGVNCIIQTMDSGYIVSGTTASSDGDVTCNYVDDNFWIVKISITGTLQWQHCYGGSGIDNPQAIKQTTDGGYILTGGTTSNDGDITFHHGGNGGDAWIIKLDSLGSIQWEKCYGGTEVDVFTSILVLNDGYLVFGSTQSNDGDVVGNHGSVDYWLISINNTGGIQWQKCYGGPSYDLGSSLMPTSEGGYVLAGSSNSLGGQVSSNHGSFDYWIVKIDSLGNIEWDKSLGGSNNEDGYISCQQTNDSGFVVAGTTESNDIDVSGFHGGFFDIWMVKLNNEDVSTHENLFSSFYVSSFQNEKMKYKFTSNLERNSEIQLQDIEGRILYSQKILARQGINEGSITPNLLSNGIYFVRLISGRASITRKLLVLN